MIPRLILVMLCLYSLLSAGEAIADGVPELHDVGTTPAAGLRFRERDSLYQQAGNTHITHCVYLPTDWKPGRTYPVLVEYAGNQFHGKGYAGPLDLDGTCAGARMGYFLAGKPGSATSGSGCIWVTLPFIRCDRTKPDDLTKHREAIRWYGLEGFSPEVIADTIGQRQATDYLMRNLPVLCARYGGDPKRVVFCGFSRGAIAGGFIGRANDATAALFCGFILHSHHDASGKPLSPSDPDGRRCARAIGRPSFLSAGAQDSGLLSTEGGAVALRAAKADVEVHIIAGIPHTDEWLLDRHYDVPAFAQARDAARTFLLRAVGDGGR